MIDFGVTYIFEGMDTYEFVFTGEKHPARGFKMEWVCQEWNESGGMYWSKQTIKDHLSKGTLYRKQTKTKTEKTISKNYNI